MTDYKAIEMLLRSVRASMLGTADEQHYWNCHVAADAIAELVAENERLRATCLCALTAINTGRSEPLFIARDEINRTLEDLSEKVKT